MQVHIALYTSENLVRFAFPVIFLHRKAPGLYYDLAGDAVAGGIV